MRLAQGRTIATNGLPISRLSVKFTVVIGNWVLSLWDAVGEGTTTQNTLHFLRCESRSVCRAIWKRMTPFKLKYKKKHLVLLSLNPSEGSTTELLCSLIIGASFSVLPLRGVADCLGVFYTTKAPPLPLCYQSTLVKLENSPPGTQPPWAVSEGPAGPLGNATKHSLCPPHPLNSSTCQPSMATWPLGQLVPQHYLPPLYTGVPKKLGTLRKGEEEALTSSSFCLWSCRNPSGEKMRGGLATQLKFRRKSCSANKIQNSTLPHYRRSCCLWLPGASILNVSKN